MVVTVMAIDELSDSVQVPPVTAPVESVVRLMAVTDLPSAPFVPLAPAGPVAPVSPLSPLAPSPRYLPCLL